ncbi:GlxA family transcriptional regulator [Actinoplanes sp. N902-109]|uniref:GlxA family transcriptional regulator n=1 Tax=Actinoplanes sp. (strain N902-109) TaxID=649831 RepID=UPI000329470F|nr:helix-turn-helix domain-containing protein [Actinoplanes sp. N902-109]AGL16848.1 AraC family transcriptional regulator [Actinoplanes sp. N902-109]
MPHRVAVLALDGVIPFDLGIPARVLGAAQDPAGAPCYEVVTCSLDGGPVATNAGFTIQVSHDRRALAGADTVVVATQEPGTAMLTAGEGDAAVLDVLRSLRPGTRVVSTCTSAFVLAAAGLLDGLAATTHWSLSDRLAALFPAVEVRPDVLFVDAGRILTSAGAAAGIDLFLHIVRTDHGAAVANAAARRCVVAPWRDGGQAQFIAHPTPPASSTGTGPTRAWALTRLDQPLTLADLAAHAAMTKRTFSRRFVAEVGVTPLQWLIAQRVDRARTLLESSDLPVERIAAQAGFGSATLLRQHLHAALGVTPQHYRRTFQAPVR